MYIPAHFAETDRDRLQAFMREHSFALLVTQVEGSPFATHLPILLDPGAGPHGTLIGHLARANPQWRSAAGERALVVFSGPHTYISPTWYEARGVVPTWNYTAVHAYGRIQFSEDPADLHGIVRQMVSYYERNMPRPWVLGEMDNQMERLLKQIVGFRIEIDTLEGKWKLNQNHPVERRGKVIRALEEQGNEDARAIGELMLAMLNSEE